MIPAPKWSPSLKWSPNRPRNDPDPETIPTFLLANPEMIPRNYGMVIKHGTGDCVFVLCWSAVILSFLFILTKFQIKETICWVTVAPVSFQSTFDLFSLMCNVSNRMVFSSSSVLCFMKRKKRKDLVDYMKNKYGEENVLEEICPKFS